MIILPILTGILRAGDDVTEAFCSKHTFQDGDILVVSSKVIATVEDAFIDLQTLSPGSDAQDWSKKTGRSPEFMEAVLQETSRLHGTISGYCPGALLTDVKHDGLRTGTILTANAGLDQSNVPEGFTVGWPRDPVESVVKLRNDIEQRIKTKKTQKTERTQKSIAVIMTDSSCRPRRLGVTAFALTVAGFDPLLPQAGREDLFGRPMRITTEAVADQLATAGNFLMGNADQATPAVIIREHGLTLSSFVGWVPGIEPQEDLFAGIL